MSELPSWLFLVFPVWVTLIVSVSVAYRALRGKPIWYRDDADTRFRERFASGSSHRTWYTKLGSARNSLAVEVTKEDLTIRPLFPFNLVFPFEIYGLEQTIPLGRVRRVEKTRMFMSDGVIVEFENEAGDPEKATLFLRRREEFVETLLQSPETIDLQVLEDSGP